MRSPVILLGLLSLGGGCLHVPDCTSTDSCRARTAILERQFARLVAEEPVGDRLDLEPVSPAVLVDRARGLVYLVNPVLTALDLRSGEARWRANLAPSDGVWRVGRSLVTRRVGPPRTEALSFVDPDAPSAPRTCELGLPVPAEASEVALYPFDRGGEVHVFWASSLRWTGGTPPGPDTDAAIDAARACGIIRLDPGTCRGKPAPLGDFLWEPPPEQRLRRASGPACPSVPPLASLPAAAASAPRLSQAPHFPDTGAASVLLQVLRERDPTSTGPCGELTHFTLEARDEAGRPLWRHALADHRAEPCHE